jgi:hypothetical protein
MSRPEYLGGEDNEFPYFEASCNEAARLTTFGSVPLLIVFQDPNWRTERMTVVITEMTPMIRCTGTTE